jgi:RNA polymerase sigma factor (sigma-70 family)
VDKISCEIQPDVLKGCRKGKEKFREILYKQFYAYGMSICLRYSYSRDEAVEVLNDSFLKVFNNLDNFDESQSFKAWFRKILINTAIDNNRKNLKHNATEDINDYYNLEYADYNVIDNLNVEDLLKLFNELPEIYRLTFNLYEIEGYSHDEIAEIIGVTASTSRSNLTRAKKIIREIYAKKYIYKPVSNVV